MYYCTRQIRSVCLMTQYWLSSGKRHCMYVFYTWSRTENRITCKLCRPSHDFFQLFALFRVSTASQRNNTRRDRESIFVCIFDLRRSYHSPPFFWTILLVTYASCSEPPSYKWCLGTLYGCWWKKVSLSFGLYPYGGPYEHNLLSAYKGYLEIRTVLKEELQRSITTSLLRT